MADETKPAASGASVAKSKKTKKPNAKAKPSRKSRLTDEQRAAIKKDKSHGMKGKELAEKYNVSLPTIYTILNGGSKKKGKRGRPKGSKSTKSIFSLDKMLTRRADLQAQLVKIDSQLKEYIKSNPQLVELVKQNG